MFNSGQETRGRTNYKQIEVMRGKQDTPEIKSNMAGIKLTGQEQDTSNTGTRGRGTQDMETKDSFHLHV